MRETRVSETRVSETRVSIPDRAAERMESESVPPAVKITELSKRYSAHLRGPAAISHLPSAVRNPERFGPPPKGFFKTFMVGYEWHCQALDSVSFSIEHGEVFGLLGPNGSGKTTLIKILSNLVTPDSGAAYVEGINALRRPYAAASRLQTVLAESIGLEKRITARQNLQLFASLYGLPRKEADDRIDRLLEYFGLSEVADRMSQAYSTGMTRKLSICRVLLSNASVILFDEPTAGLDPSAADDLRQLILQDLVKREKKTVMLATHNLAEANSMCTRIGLLKEGRLIAVGSPEEVRKNVEDRVDLVVTLGGVDSHPDELQRELEKVDGVFSVAIVNTQGTKQIRLSGRKDLHYLDVFSLVSSHGLRVLSMETSSPSLEDAFFRLTREAEK
jgi:ABC-2 type transport system ATP-binding protein